MKIPRYGISTTKAKKIKPPVNEDICGVLTAIIKSGK